MYVIVRSSKTGAICLKGREVPPSPDHPAGSTVCVTLQPGSEMQITVAKANDLPGVI
jgi:hypothetical protein